MYLRILFIQIRGEASMSSGISIHPCAPRNDEAVAALSGLPSSVIGDVMGRLVGTTGLCLVNRTSLTVCGVAVTVRVRAGDNLLIHKALDMLRPGDVLVVDGEGDVSRALVGEIMMTSAIVQGAIGFVMDGAVRDSDAFEAHKFPCWARGVNLRGPYKDGPGAINMPVTVGGMLVNPGDIIVGDADGVVAVPAADALLVGKKAHDKVRDEQKMIADIKSGVYSSAWVDALIKQKGD
jgi:regulator of RNase E activity RraA